MDGPFPRVNLDLLRSMVGKQVTLAGKVLGYENGKLKVETSDKGIAYVITNNNLHDGGLCEIWGTVTDPKTIKEESHIYLSEGFRVYILIMLVSAGLDLYNDLVKATFKYPDHFF